LQDEAQLEAQEQRRLAEEDRARHIHDVNNMIQQWKAALTERDTQLANIHKELEVACITV
jgi:hypothetical protein